MKTKEWYQVDNVANVFLSTISTRDPRTLRITCTLKEEIDPVTLQEALNETVSLLPQFNVLIHRGLFWNYIDKMKTIPTVHEEFRRVCPVLYEKGNYSRTHYELSYFGNRINFDLLHAVSDGTGAIEFLNYIVFNYLKRKHPDTINNSIVPELTPKEATLSDGYRENYEDDPKAPDPVPYAYRPKSMKLPFDQLQFMEVHMPADEMKKRAKAMNVTITSYISAKLISAFLKEKGSSEEDKPVILTIPVNLRKYYDSKTLRNFFNNVSLPYYSKGEDKTEDIAREFDRILKEQIEPEKIKQHMNHFQKLQQNPGIRFAPLFLKQPALRFASWMEDKHVSAVVSNLGIYNIPAAMGEYVESYCQYCSSQNIFVCCGTFKNSFTIGITNPYINTNILRDFIRGFSEDGIPVHLEATEVVK